MGQRHKSAHVGGPGRWFFAGACLLLAACPKAAPELPVPVPALATHACPSGGVQIAQFVAPDRRLRLELLDDDLVRVTYLALPAGGAFSDVASDRAPMVVNRRYPGPRRLTRSAPYALETATLKLTIDPQSLAVTISDLRRGQGALLARIAPEVRAADHIVSGVAVARNDTTHVLGLGQQFVAPGRADATNWLGQVRAPGHAYGNRMVPFHGGAVGNTQFPVAYALATGNKGYGLFVDHGNPQTWDLSKDPWRVTIAHPDPALSLYIFAGQDLVALRSHYMSLVGLPLVPPLSAFGLWVSEYGYRSFDEVEALRARLAAHGFPVDGFVLDLFWFGGVERESPKSKMGRLTWDETHFADARNRLAALAQKGVRVMVIEEPYVSRGLAEYQVLARAGYLARRGDGDDPAVVSEWWGSGGWVDFTSPAAGDFWHDFRRRALIHDGVAGHWTDLGEPECYLPNASYAGLPPRFHQTHVANANLYAFSWLASIYRGYQRHHEVQRPFMLSRSGAPGMQRFGAALWSGDIGSNQVSLAAHMNAQLHMSLSGIDYYGADIGGFRREALDTDENALYTAWFAAGAAVDVPVRPHTENLSRERTTAPDGIGDRASNLANLELRYQLAPTIYSLAHQAHLTGEAVFPPLVYRYQSDPVTRTLGTHKLIGPHLLVRLVPTASAKQTDVYLPAGEWVDFHTLEPIASRGQWLRNVPLFDAQGRFRLPLYAARGAIVAEQAPAPRARNIQGDGTRRGSQLRLRVFPGAAQSSFSLFEDDGFSNEYLRGSVRTTTVTQALRRDGALEVRVAGARGEFSQASTTRSLELLVAGMRKQPVEVRVDGQPVARGDMSPSGAVPRTPAGCTWNPAQPGRPLEVRCGPKPVTEGRVVEVRY